MPRPRLGFLVLILVAMVPVSCSGGKDAEIAALKSELASMQTAAAEKERDESSPKLYRDERMEDVIQQLGNYVRVFVFRWQNGVVDGTVESDVEGGPKQIPLDESLQAFKFRAEKDEKLKATDFSGEMVLALRKLPDTKDYTFECTRSVRYGYRIRTGPQTSSGGDFGFATKPFKVKMEPDPKVKIEGLEPLGGATKFAMGAFNPTTKGAFSPTTINRFVDQKEVPWLKLRLVEK